VPLKAYYWLVTLQLILDVFRADILKLVFRFDPTRVETPPCRVIVYNVAYLIYAIMVLRLGVTSVFVNDIEPKQCPTTAPELFKASTAFVTLSLAAWTTILFGYVLPLCIVAAMLTHNGYNPSNEGMVLPAAYNNGGAPPETIDELPIVESVVCLGQECCICMEEFTSNDVIVETPCHHVFHKPCCKEWLSQARTCPVCRANVCENTEGGGRMIPLGPTGRPVQGLFRMLATARSEDNEDVEQGRRQSQQAG
jgi:hypothetical protein